MLGINYGQELILDIHECNIEKFNRKDIENYLLELCDDIIDMERADLHWWDYEDDDQEDYDSAPSHLKGTSCVQFITTSTIVIHTLDDLKKMFINVFSCKEFDANKVVDFTTNYFGGKIITKKVVNRI
jgi:S-adenosylmethionine/arginine decarboxylase-like enzyme